MWGGKGRGEVLKMRFRYYISLGKVILYKLAGFLLLW